MLARVLEPEVMDTPGDADEYDAMDHSAVNRVFAADFLALAPSPAGPVLDVGTGTALIPIELCRQSPTIRVVGMDLAASMLERAALNVNAAGVGDRVTLELANGRSLPYTDGRFVAVVSNSIIHHIPEPFDCFAEMARVCAAGGRLFVRDLVRPATEGELEHLVRTYAADATDYQRRLFADSLRAALTLDEVQSLVARLGFPPDTVRLTSDRHWTFAGSPS